MPFLQDHLFAELTSGVYGNYFSTFRSQNEQVIAHLFERGGWLVAHVSFAPGFSASTVTDPYWGELHRYARDHGFGDKLQIRLS